jgi:hypothetical protein
MRGATGVELEKIRKELYFVKKDVYVDEKKVATR